MPLLSKLIGAAQAIKNKKTTARRFLRARQMMLDNLKARQLPRRACQKPTEVGEPTDFVFPQFGEEPEVEVTSNMAGFYPPSPVEKERGLWEEVMEAVPEPVFPIYGLVQYPDKRYMVVHAASEPAEPTISWFKIILYCLLISHLQNRYPSWMLGALVGGQPLE